MFNINISQLKVNPSKAIIKALDYPVAVESRNKVKAYLIGKDLYEKLVAYLEDQIDTQITQETDFSKGKDFEKVVKKLGV